MPFFPVEDALLGDSQEFGDLPKGDDEGFGVDAMAYGLHGRLLLVNGLAVETTAICGKTRALNLPWWLFILDCHQIALFEYLVIYTNAYSVVNSLKKKL